MIGANNLVVGAGGITNAATARSNLGLGTAAQGVIGGAPGKRAGARRFWRDR